MNKIYGRWDIKSVRNPRWNAFGYGNGTVLEGGPQEMYDWVDKCTKEFGEKPDDLICRFKRIKNGKKEEEAAQRSIS